jgi:hypothetical protein
MAGQHVLEIWDPAEGAETMQSHLRVLLNSVRNYRAGRHSDAEVFVWWGHRRTPGATPSAFERLGPIPVEADRNDPGPETHLYLTDLSSLYVAHLGGVTRDAPKPRDDHVPHLYRQRDTCDGWYRLWDVRRLVDRDTSAVAREFRKLRNPSEGNRPVVLHDGLPRAPFVVADSGEVRYFDPPTRKHYIDDQFWVEFDAERGGIGSVERELRENLFGEEAWGRFGPLARSFVATGEKLWRDHAGDPMFDVGVVLLELSKAVEARTNGALREVLAGAPERVRSWNSNGSSIDVTRNHLGLLDLSQYMLSSEEVFTYLKTHARHGSWFAGQLPPILEDLTDARNRAAHGLEVTWQEVSSWRARLLGVGCHGYLVQLGSVARV